MDIGCGMEAKTANGKLIAELEAGYFQAGTLGGGNHFIEIQEDEEGKAGIMIHSGSRNFGYKICRYFNSIAKDFNSSGIPQYLKTTGLPFFNNHVNCYHNYADLENHYRKNVWVHRKGAIRARENDIGIIPGAMVPLAIL